MARLDIETIWFRLNFDIEMMTKGSSLVKVVSKMLAGKELIF